MIAPSGNKTENTRLFSFSDLSSVSVERINYGRTAKESVVGTRDFLVKFTPMMLCHCLINGFSAFQDHTFVFTHRYCLIALKKGNHQLHRCDNLKDLESFSSPTCGSCGSTQPPVLRATDALRLEFMRQKYELTRLPVPNAELQ